MEEEIWLKTSFTEEDVLNWPCPHCNKGLLQPVRNKGFDCEETIDSKENRQRNPDWEPEWMQFICCVKLICNTCQGVVVSVGEATLTPSYSEEYQYIYEFTPKFFYPSLNIININKKWPEKIRQTIKESFALFWVNPASCANKIRVALELLMIEQKIEKFPKNLNKRIDKEFRKKESELADLILAVKWIGNEGSHLGSLKRQDIIDAYSILEHALNKLYDDREKMIKNKATKINKHKGVPKTD